MANTAPNGYKWCHLDRSKARGGGVALLYNNEIKCTEKSKSEDSDIEFLWCVLTVALKTVHYVVVYRPPSGSHSHFRKKFSTLLEDIEAYNSDIIITGDFNIHMDNLCNLDTQKFNQLLSDFGLESNVNGLTHIGGHTLDLVISRQESGLVKKVQTDDIVSDHLMLCFTMSLHSTATVKNS